MPHRIDPTSDPQAANRQPVRRLRQVACASHAHDPRSRARRKPLLAPGNLLLFTGMAAFGLYATGHLGTLDRFLDRAQTFGRAHNELAVRGILHYLTATLVLSAAAVVFAMAIASVRTRANRQKHSRFNDSSLDAAMATVLRASLHRSSLDQAAELAAQAQLRGEKQEARPWPNTRAANAGQGGDRSQPVGSAKEASFDESLPTLPVHARVRRRDPHGKLPPQVAAALRVAAATPRR